MTNVYTNRSSILGCTPFGGIYNPTDGEYSITPLGTIAKGANGHDYMYVQASAGIADNTASILTEGNPPAYTVAGGAGAWTTRSGAVTTGQRFWIEKTAI